jgi:hypothetical protein
MRDDPIAVSDDGNDDQPRVELHGLFQFVGRSKRDLLARLDLDCFACRGIASHPGRPFADLEDAKAGQADFVALLQMARSEGHQIAKYRFSLLFR